MKKYEDLFVYFFDSSWTETTVMFFENFNER